MNAIQGAPKKNSKSKLAVKFILCHFETDVADEGLGFNMIAINVPSSTYFFQGELKDRRRRCEREFQAGMLTRTR